MQRVWEGRFSSAYISTDCGAANLIEIGRRDLACYRPDSGHKSGALGYGDDTSSVHQIEEVGTLQAMVVGCQDRVSLTISAGRLAKTFKQLFRLPLMGLELHAEFLCVTLV